MLDHLMRPHPPKARLHLYRDAEPKCLPFQNSRAALAVSRHGNTRRARLFHAFLNESRDLQIALQSETGIYRICKISSSASVALRKEERTLTQRGVEENIRGVVRYSHILKQNSGHHQSWRIMFNGKPSPFACCRDAPVRTNYEPALNLRGRTLMLKSLAPIPIRKRHFRPWPCPGTIHRARHPLSQCRSRFQARLVS